MLHKGLAAHDFTKFKNVARIMRNHGSHRDAYGRVVVITAHSSVVRSRSEQRMGRSRHLCRCRYLRRRPWRRTRGARHLRPARSGATAFDSSAGTRPLGRRGSGHLGNPALCGFVCSASADGTTAATWLSQDGSALYVAGLRNVMDIGGRLQMGFSLRVASSASMPKHRPLCIEGDLNTWLQLSGADAMRQFTPWRLERCAAAAGVRPEWAREAPLAQVARV